MTITSAERTALLSLVRARDKVIKASIKVRAAEMLADFERDITKFYGSDHDDIWDNIRKGVATITDEANEKITALCKRVGVSRGGVPTIYVSWYGYGRENLEEKREELRKRAKAEITLKTKEAEARHAKTINE